MHPRYKDKRQDKARELNREGDGEKRERRGSGGRWDRFRARETERRETLAWRSCPSRQTVALSPAPMRISSVVVIQGQASHAVQRGSGMDGLLAGLAMTGYSSRRQDMPGEEEVTNLRTVEPLLGRHDTGDKVMSSSSQSLRPYLWRMQPHSGRGVTTSFGCADTLGLRRRRVRYTEPSIIHWLSSWGCLLDMQCHPAVLPGHCRRLRGGT